MPTRLIVALLATGLALGGCQTVAGETPAILGADDQVVEAPLGTPEPDTGSGEEPDSGMPELTLSPCDEVVKGAIDATIGAQTQAFRDGDFDAAYALASPSFQAGVPLDVFSSLIRLNYPQLLTADNARSGSCEADVPNGLATILVRFVTSSDPAYTLRYVMELVEGQWRVSGANQELVADTVA
jgi:hypothetical protein